MNFEEICEMIFEIIIALGKLKENKKIFIYNCHGLLHLNNIFYDKKEKKIKFSDF
jgi:aminoglycoside phosphotransferase family enzyme